MGKKNPTLATFKSFIRKNKGRLLIRVKRQFDGMVDGCVSTGEVFYTPVIPADVTWKNNLGIQGVWLVFGSMDFFSPVNENGFCGFEVSNCCGSFSLVVYEAG